MMPEISVVMTSYNHERYLPEAIESVLGQTYKNIELIIVDDASADRSRDIIIKYADKDERVRYIFHDKNLGISRTINDGFGKAKGNFIAFMDSDDVWFLQKLETQIQVLKQSPNLVVWSDAVIIDSQGKDTGQLATARSGAQNMKKSGNIFEALLNRSMVYLQTALFLREYIQKIHFDPGLQYANDYKFAIELAENYEFHFIPEPLVKYRVHGKNTCFRDRELWDRDEFILQKDLLRKYKDRIPPKIQAKYYCKIGRYIFNHGHQRYSRPYLWKAVRRNFLKTTYGKTLLKSFFARHLK